MAQTTLVDPRRIKQGERLLEELDKQRLPVFAAFWQWQDDAGEWRLIIGSDLVPAIGPTQVLRRIDAVLERLNEPIGEDYSTYFVPTSPVSAAPQFGLVLRDVTVVGPQDPTLDVLHDVPFTSPHVTLPQYVVEALPLPQGLYVYRNNPRSVAGIQAG